MDDTVDPINNDFLNHPKEETELYFAKLSECTEKMIHTHSFAELEKLIESITVPMGYKNLLYVLSAEVSRKRKWFDSNNNLINRCSNPILKQAWHKWQQRFI